MANQVSIIQGERYEVYDLDDGVRTVDDALSKFSCDHDEDENTEFRVNGRVVDPSAALRDGDSIVILSVKVARGGMKQGR